MTVWDDLVGQKGLVTALRDVTAAADRVLQGEKATGMTHAWLFTGPPGSGRSTAARAFAAALQCDRAGCGLCLSCRTAVAGSHADISSLVTEQAVIGVDDARDSVRRAALSPSGRRWQVMIVEDADRLTDRAADALLKSVEEPPPRTVWLLCAPTAEDVLPTIRSRCRCLVLRTPPSDAIADHLVGRHDVPTALASFTARAAQGHIGRARALALDEGTRNRRREVLRLPGQLSDLGSCLNAASNVVVAANEEAKPRSDALDAKEQSDLQLTYGAGTRGVSATGYSAAAKELQRRQKLRAKRLVRDSIDRTLLDLASYYRDVVTVQLGSAGELVNEELRHDVVSMSRSSSAEATVRRLRAIFDTRDLLEGEIAPLLALESLMISLRGAADA